MNLMKDEIILEKGEYNSTDVFHDFRGLYSNKWSTTITNHRIQVAKRIWVNTRIETIMLEDITSFRYVKPSHYGLSISAIIFSIVFLNLLGLIEKIFLPSIIQWTFILLFFVFFFISHYYFFTKHCGIFILTASRKIKIFRLRDLKEKKIIDLLDKLESAKNERYLTLKK